LRKPPELELPRRRRTPWWIIAASVLLHALILAIPFTEWGWTPPELSPMTYTPLVVDLPAPTERVRRPERPVERPPPPHEVEEPVARATDAPAGEQAAEPAGVPEAPRDTTTGVAVQPPRAGDPGVPRIRPQLGEGRLWVQPLPLPPSELAQRLARSHFELVDSAVSAIVQRYIDSLLNAPAPSGTQLPAWTTEIAGKTWGIDQRFIHLGGFKIPTALLALLPIPSTSNLDLQQSHRMNDIRSDLLYATQRAATMDEFKAAIREIRLRRERERQLERNQRQPPSDTLPRP